MKRVYILMGISGLYCVNRFLILPGLDALSEAGQGGEVPYRLLSSYGSDVLAGAWILCFLNLVMVWSGRRAVRRLAPAALFVLGCGIFWEYITPLYLSRAVSDPMDVVAYLVGGCMYMLLERGIKSRR